MAREKVIADFIPERITVGLSSIIGVSVRPGQISVSLEWLSGGTLLIVNPNTPALWDQGFVVPGSAICSFDMIGTLYLAAQSATTVVSVLRGRSQGFEGQP